MSTHKRNVNSYGGTNTGSELFVSAISDNYIMGDSGNMGDRTLGLICPISFGLREVANEEEYAKKAIMSIDGLFRPVSLGGDGGLPRFANGPTSCLLQGPKDRMPPVSYDSSSLYNLAINGLYLNPLTNPDGKDWDDKHGTSAGHDIDIVARGDTVPTGQFGLVNGLESDEDLRYADDYRFMALKGPVVIHGWGYDTNGKPIPNKADSESSAKVGSFTSTDLEDEFMDDWLQKSSTWPVAPLDIRYDRNRGVWVSPPANKLLFVKATGSISPGAIADVRVLQGENLYDSDGSTIVLADSENTALANIRNIGEVEIPSGSKFYAYYDTDTCEYWPIGGNAGGSGCPNFYTRFRVEEALGGMDVDFIIGPGEDEEFEDAWGCSGEVDISSGYFVRDPLEFFPASGKYDIGGSYFDTRGITSYDKDNEEHVVIAGPYTWPKLAIINSEKEVIARTPHLIKFGDGFDITELDGNVDELDGIEDFNDKYGVLVKFSGSGEYMSEITGVETDCENNQIKFKRRKIKVMVLSDFEEETDLTLTLYPQEVVVDVTCSGG